MTKRRCFVQFGNIVIAAMFLVELVATAANAGYPIFKLDIGRGHDPAETQAGFTAFTVNDSGTIVDGIKVEIAPIRAGETIQARWRGGPTGIPYERLHRDFIFTVNDGWRIDLKEFADQGVNLTSVNSIAIGIGTKGNTTTAGGSGTAYFDDIRLYRPDKAAGQ